MLSNRNSRVHPLCFYQWHWQIYLLKKINFKRGKIRLWDKICYLCYISDPILALPNTCISLNIQQHHGPQHSTTLNSTHKTQLTTTSWIRTFRAGTPRSHTHIYLVLRACILCFVELNISFGRVIGMSFANLIWHKWWRKWSLRRIPNVIAK